MNKTTRLVSQPSRMPTRKVRYGALNGALIGIVAAWVLGEFGVVMPDEVAIAFGSIVAGIVAYFVREEDSPGVEGT